MSRTTILLFLGPLTQSCAVLVRLRNGRWDWGSLGFRRPASWRRIVLIALAAAAVRIALGDLVIDPLTAHF